MEFLGKRVLVTGAAHGIGAATARKFHSLGAEITLLDIEAEALRTIADELRARATVIDLRVVFGNEKALRQLGDFDVLVNNAGYNIDAPFLAYESAEISDLLALNLLAPMAVMRAFAPGMISCGGGVVVNVCSQLAFRGSPNRTIYAASKAALVHLTQSLAAEWGPSGVRVVGIAPGRTATRMTEQIRSTISQEELAGTVPLARFGSPEEIADAVCFVASERAGYVSGTTLVVDGGFLSR